MGLQDMLRALGLGPGEQVQPDVSGFTLANLVLQTRGAPDPMIAALGSLYEEVQVIERSDTRLVLDLWRAGQPMAAMHCTYGAQTRCTFTYWDPEPEVNAFLQQISGWADAELGPLTQGVDDLGHINWTASNGAATVTLSRPADGAEAQAVADFELA